MPQIVVFCYLKACASWLCFFVFVVAKGSGRWTTLDITKIITVYSKKLTLKHIRSFSWHFTPFEVDKSITIIYKTNNGIVKFLLQKLKRDSERIRQKVASAAHSTFFSCAVK